MILQYFSRHISFARTFQESPSYSSTFSSLCKTWRSWLRADNLTLQLDLQSWLMKDAGPSHNWAQFFLQENITLKSLCPGVRSWCSSSSVSSAIQPINISIFSCFCLLHGKIVPINITIFSCFCLLHGKNTVKTLYNATRYNRIFNIRHKIAGNGSVSIKIPSL